VSARRAARSPLARAGGVALLVAAVAACGPSTERTLVEPWGEVRPRLRVGALLDRGEVRALVAALDDAPLRFTADDAWTEGAELWVLAFDRATLARAFPGLPLDDDDALEALRPTIDAEAPAAPPATALLRDARAREAGAATLTPAESAAFEAALPEGTHLGLAGVDVTAQCRPDAVRAWPLPAGHHAIGVAADATHALVLTTTVAPTIERVPDGGEALGTVAAWRVGLVDGVTTALPAPGLVGPLRGLRSRLAVDRRAGLARGADATGATFALALATGARVDAPAPPDRARWPKANGRAFELAEAPDGYTLALWEDETTSPSGIPGTAPTPYVLDDAARWQRVVQQGEPLSHAQTYYLRAAGRGRVLFYQGCYLLVPKDVDEGEWLQRAYDPACAYNTRRLITLRDADLDDTLAITAGRQGHVAWRAGPELDADWRTTSLGDDTWLAVVTVGDRRAVLVDARGAVQLFRDGRVCALRAAPALDAPPTAVFGDPARGRAIVGTADGALLVVDTRAP
jgi:hypothetical protein